MKFTIELFGQFKIVNEVCDPQKLFGRRVLVVNLYADLRNIEGLHKLHIGGLLMCADEWPHRHYKIACLSWLGSGGLPV